MCFLCACQCLSMYAFAQVVIKSLFFSQDQNAVDTQVTRPCEAWAAIGASSSRLCLIPDRLPASS